MSRSLMFAALMISLALVASYSFIINSDTKFKRTRVNRSLMELRDRIKSNPEDKEALTNLIAALDDPYHFKRSGAASMLGQLGPVAEEAVPALSRALTSGDGYLSREAALSLRKIGLHARGAIPALIEALKLGNCDTAWFSAQALGNMGCESKTVVPALIACLDVPSEDQFYGSRPGSQLALEATVALGKFDGEAREALPALNKKLEGANAEFRFYLARAIRLIDPENTESLNVLITFIGDRELNSLALTALGELGTNASSAIPALESYLKQDLSGADKQQALDTLWRLAGTNSHGGVLQQIP